MKEVDCKFPTKLKFLFFPKRYKVAYGGRGGAKSWGFARALLIKGTEQPLRILCARELQKSIKDSVHKLLADQIKELNLHNFYEVQQAKIEGKNGTQFFFEGLRHSVTNIKSYEGVDIVWVEEAQTVSKSSWSTLIPTIRKDDSEIWVSFNPELEEDETYQRFVLNAPKNAEVVKINWDDNPWFPSVLQEEMDELKERDYDAYLNVWEGHCRESLEGAIYANQLREAKQEDRITRVPYDTTKPVDVYWDLGWSDFTTMWFIQSVGMEIRAIDYYQNQLQPLNHYLKVLSEKPYHYKTMHLPHDARAKQLGTGKSIEELVGKDGHNVSIVPGLTVIDGINAARMMFNRVWFDREKCADGLQALRHYRFEVDRDTGRFGPKPLHDWASHGADGFRYIAVGIKEMRKLPRDRKKKVYMRGTGGRKVA